MKPGLSKSRLAEWRQCPKRLWLRTHHPDLAEVSQESERAFQTGHEVGTVARELHPGGHLVDTDDVREALRLTQRLLAEHPGEAIFEATFERDGVLVRADLLLPEAGGYRLVEVKSASSVKDYYGDDVAIQRWVVGAHLPLVGTELAHVDTGFVYPGGGDYRGLFANAPMDAATEELLEEVPGWVEGARTTISSDEPGIEPGDHCSDPYPCPFVDHCWRDVVEPDLPIRFLPNLSSGKREQLEAAGIADLRDIPADFPLTDNQSRVLRVTLAGRAELLADAARELAALGWPRYFLDFETVRMAVPVWAGTRPYQFIPVQWSCHAQSAPGTGLAHQAFLADGPGDPRQEFARSMIAALGSAGPVLVFNQSFELGRIKELARDFPGMSGSLEAIASRVVDLLPIARRSYYHPDMEGSWSIKAILPTLGGTLTYDGQAIADGGEAEAAWLEILHPETVPERREELRKGLADYCALDTLAMVKLADFLAAPAGL